MDGVSAEQEHYQLSLPTRKFQNLHIPPRMLLTRRLAALSSEPSMEMLSNHHYQYQYHDHSPRVLSEETLFHKFLPNSGLDDDSDPYASDEFRMYEFKIRKCTRSRSHDWTDCPFAHPGEKARRRCPRRFSYAGTMCPDFRRGSCVRGDTCEFAHGVFEYWLHPSRYRTEACKDGRYCLRKICFFAHTSSELRPVSPVEMVVPPNKHCPCCRCHRGIHHTVSPTSILDANKLSPPVSPKFTPTQCVGRFSPVSRFHVESSSFVMTQHGNPVSSYKELMTPREIEINELMHNLKAMNMNAIDRAPNSNPVRVDSFAVCNDDQRLFFPPSPSTPSCSASGSNTVSPGDCNYAMNNLNDEDFENHETAITCPELEWVDDLLT